MIDYVSNIRALRVKRWVYDKDEKIGDCFKNVLSLFSHSDNTLAFVLHRTPSNTEMYFIVKNEGLGRNEYSKNNIMLLSDSLCGNFPGTDVEVVDEQNGGMDTKQLFNFDKASSIAVLCNIPSAKSKDYISQGIEKLLNGVVPNTDDENYTVVILAQSLPQVSIRAILSGFEEMATAITPFSGYQFQMGQNNTETQGEMESLSHSEGVSRSISKTHSINVGINGSIISAVTAAASVGLSAGAGILVANVGASAGASLAKTVGQSLGASAGYGYSWGKTETKSVSDTKTTGTNHSISVGSSENTTYTYKSYLASCLIQKIEATIKRIDESQSTGLWKCSSYVLASDAKTSKNVANFLRSITQGDESFIEPSIIQEWSFEESNGITAFSEIKKYLKHFSHPIFVNRNDGMIVTPTANVTTSELSNAIAFPRYSLPGIPVIECARFGREPHSLSKINGNLNLGCAYHMYQEEKQNRIFLDKNELAKHTFITGSTGSGKSNTIYKILSELESEGVKFLVVEPAKGEYKNVFGDRDNVQVYGTNPKITKILRINPFKFPSNIHILEHLDRLVEIFNVCWPMYAAMPAILKDSIERAYSGAGWDLKKSENRHDDRLFPTFTDILEQIRIVLNESDYSTDNKGDYIGALATRVKSLTNGINGMIFTQNDLSDEDLFDNNVIVDLSRIGSSETKALIMGLLVMKLQEYRMTSGKQNAKLSHITVLEEAHNLLKRTSTEQRADGANLLGKSVEMLVNAIAEMRTYGEGFIIADQSPGLLDVSVIRNTNTKIILRLPDFSDRQLVGKSAGLNDDQIAELSKLQQGVAVISQSDWLEPVLCKVDKFDYKEKPYVDSDNYNGDDDAIQQSLLELIMEKEIYRRGDRLSFNHLTEAVIRSSLRTTVKSAFLDYINSDDENSVTKLRVLVYEFFDAKNAVNRSKGCDEIKNWAISVANHVLPSIQGFTKQQIDLVLALIVHEQAQRDVSYNDLLCRFVEMHKTHGCII